MRRWLLLCLVLMACSGDDKDDTALLGCRNFREVAKDYNDGAIAGFELRPRVQDVREDSEFAPADVQEAANAMVRASSPFDDAAMAIAVRQMDRACKSAGY